MADGPVVSLLPAATEIICALGAADRLAAVSHECDHPESITGLPRLTRTRTALGGSGAQIDDRVRDLVERGLAIYQVDADALRQLAPDVIVTQTQCDVCAVSPGDLHDAVAGWIGAPPTVVSLEALTLDAIWTDIFSVGVALGLEREAGDLVERLKTRVKALERQVPDGGRRPRVGVLEWMSPLMAGGNWMPELLEIAGCELVWGDAGAHSPWLDADDLVDADPDILLVIPCGYAIDHTMREIKALTDLEVWSGLRAVREGRVFAADGNAYFNRPGPRIVESIEILIDIAHGAGSGDSFGGFGWTRHI